MSMLSNHLLATLHFMNLLAQSLASGNLSSTKVRPPQKKGSVGNGTKSSMLLGKGVARGSGTQRQHPGMLSAQNRATAHYGAVTGLQMTNDGFHLFSAGICLSTFLKVCSCSKVSWMQVMSSYFCGIAFVTCIGFLLHFPRWLLIYATFLISC